VVAGACAFSGRARPRADRTRRGQRRFVAEPHRHHDPPRRRCCPSRFVRRALGALPSSVSIVRTSAHAIPRRSRCGTPGGVGLPRVVDAIHRRAARRSGHAMTTPVLDVYASKRVTGVAPGDLVALTKPRVTALVITTTAGGLWL